METRMEQLHVAPRARHRKQPVQPEFDASKIFGTPEDDELEIDYDAARSRAQKDQRAAEVGRTCP